MSTFAKRLLKARKFRGLTHEYVARHLNVSKQLVSHWENGRCTITLEHAKPLASVLGVRVEWLIFGSGDIHA